MNVIIRFPLFLPNGFHADHSSHRTVIWGLQDLCLLAEQKLEAGVEYNRMKGVAGVLRGALCDWDGGQAAGKCEIISRHKPLSITKQRDLLPKA
ncbi:hypothetical protein FKM82_004998 [Ascaphus truei]